MAMEQVSLQELQRLNDAINATFDAIRRVAPQLQALQQVTQTQAPFGWYGMNVPMQNPMMQQPLGGIGFGIGQQHVLPLVHQLAQQVAHQITQQLAQTPYGQYGVGQPYGQQPFGVPQWGQQYGGQLPFGMQQPFQPNMSSPLQPFGQRVF